VRERKDGERIWEARVWETLPFQLNGMARGAPFRLRQVGCARVKANGGVDGSQHHRGCRLIDNSSELGGSSSGRRKTDPCPNLVAWGSDSICQFEFQRVAQPDTRQPAIVLQSQRTSNNRFPLIQLHGGPSRSSFGIISPVYCAFCRRS